jgi:hypothetical protein
MPPSAPVAASPSADVDSVVSCTFSDTWSRAASACSVLAVTSTSPSGTDSTASIAAEVSASAVRVTSCSMPPTAEASSDSNPSVCGRIVTNAVASSI